MKFCRSEQEQYEKIPVEIFADSSGATRQLAAEIAALIKERNGAGRPAVLGLATGSTPVPLYRELIRLHREEGLSFQQVVTFNLDEYYPVGDDHRESYHRFMAEQLFNHVDIPASNIHIPDGNVPRDSVFETCRNYETAIEAAGGIDLQVLGIGMTGHIGFNEPGSGRDSRTRLITLDRITRRDAARDFLGLENVPRYAITMGVGTILQARRIVLMAWGQGKAAIVARAVEGPASDAVSASFLQHHARAAFYIDQPAAAALTRIKHPWLVGAETWEPPEIRNAVCWLAGRLEKPVLKLLDEEYNENGMASLLAEQGPAYTLNIRIFNELQHTITGWPGGKPGADDTHRPERALPFPKRVLVFSPEPSDDAAGLGGTLDRLVSQGHDVQVVYQTSGNLAVPDSQAATFARFLLESARARSTGWEEQVRYGESLLKDLEEKGPFGVDSRRLRDLKGLIRRGEARESARILGLDPERLIFLDLPFYEAGRYRRFSLTGADTAAIGMVLDRCQPHQIYATGKLADPSSVPAQCFNALAEALRQRENHSWRQTCTGWLYSAHDRQLEPHQIGMAVPLSPDQLSRKLQAIGKHPSQQTQFAQTGEPDQQTARRYDRLGLAEYEAIEAFERWF